MSDYKVMFYYSHEDEAYIACVPELPGCMADGATIEEAAKNAEEAISVWLETANELGRPIPDAGKLQSISKATSVDVAKYILEKLGKIQAMALEKLTYYCKVWSLVWYGKSIIVDTPEAWAKGPVFPALFSKHKGRRFVSAQDIMDASALTEDEKRVVDHVLEVYGDFDGDELSRMTHDEDPWRIARSGLPDDAVSDVKISDENIMNYYGQLKVAV